MENTRVSFRPLESKETLRVEETSDTGLEDEKDQDVLASKERIKALERRTTRNLNHRSQIPNTPVYRTMPRACGTTPASEEIPIQESCRSDVSSAKVKKVSIEEHREQDQDTLRRM